MNTVSFFTASLVLFLVSLRASAQPTEEVRPTIPTLYLTTAGPVATVTETMMTSFTNVTICPADYPAGFSVRCETTTGPDFPTVRFIVSGGTYKKEFKAPYYLAGNTRNGTIVPFPFSSFGPADKIRGTRLRVICKVRTRKGVFVDLVDMC